MAWKQKIKIFLAREWIVFLIFLFIGVFLSIISENTIKEFCYKYPSNYESLTLEQKRVVDGIESNIKEFKYLSYDLKEILFDKKDEKLAYIISICDNKNSLEYEVGTEYVLKYPTSILLVILFGFYFLYILLRIIFIITKISIKIIKENKNKETQ